MRSCINFCAPVFEGEIVDENVLCPLDPCDEELWISEEVWRCPVGDAAGQGFRCARFEDGPDPDRIGRCVDANEVVATCDPAANDCATNTFCLNVGECPDESSIGSRLGVPADAAGFCWLPQREGEPCSGDIGDTDQGCLPCESGTWCRTTDRGPRCVRSCSAPGAPEVARPELCGCSSGEGSCLHWEEMGLEAEAFGVAAGEPLFYCNPPRVPNGHRCDPEAGLDCADPAAGCLPAIDPRTGSEHTFCCREDGTACSDNADCCLGYYSCQAGTCLPCGREGEPPNDGGCCFGYTPIDGICRSCTTDEQARDLHSAGTASCDGSFVTLHGTDGDETLALPRDGSTGASPGDIPLTSGQVEAVTYDAPEHQIFLLQGDLSGSDPTFRVEGPDPYGDADGDGVPNWSDIGASLPGSSYLHLPTSAPGGSSVDVTPLTPGPSTWTSLRAYHSGVCGSFLPWRDVIDAVAANVNNALVDPQWGIFGASPLTLNAAQVNVHLESGTGPLGRSITNDMVSLLIEYQAVGGEAVGCPEGRIHLRLYLRVRRRAATIPSWEGEVVDETLLQEHACDPDLLAQLHADRPELTTITDCSETCYGRGDEYACFVSFNGDGTHYGWSHVRHRDVLTLTNAYDFEPEILWIDGGLVDCGWPALNWLIQSNIRGTIESKFDTLLRRVVENQATNLPNAALGIAYDDMPLCGRVHPITGETVPSSYLCSASPLFGNRRVRCLGFDEDRRREDNPAMVHEYRCAQIGTEVRRVNLRPDGLELVLVDSTSEPQYPLISTILPSYCGSARDGINPPAPGGQPISSTINLTNSRIVTTLGGAARRICSSSDTLVDADGDGAFDGCAGLCADRGHRFSGIPCRDGLLRIAAGDTEATLSSRCYVGRNGDDHPVADCCEPSQFCPVSASGGGFTFSDGMTYRCIGNFDTDEFACGGCGTVCAAGDQCCDGGCIDPSTSSDHCGTCGNACATGETCSSGVCT